MRPKEDVLMELLAKSQQARQIQAIIRQVLSSNHCALSISELHSELQAKGYRANFGTTKKNLWVMAKNGDVIVSSSKPRLYFII